jgi:hypothetical protein
MNSFYSDQTVRIRKPIWNPQAYLELPPLVNGMKSPWVTLHDPASNAGGANDIPVDQQFLAMQCDDGATDWEKI